MQVHKLMCYFKWNFSVVLMSHYYKKITKGRLTFQYSTFFQEMVYRMIEEIKIHLVHFTVTLQLENMQLASFFISLFQTVIPFQPNAIY